MTRRSVIASSVVMRRIQARRPEISANSPNTAAPIRQASQISTCWTITAATRKATATASHSSAGRKIRGCRWLWWTTASPGCSTRVTYFIRVPSGRPASRGPPSRHPGGGADGYCSKLSRAQPQVRTLPRRPARYNPCEWGAPARPGADPALNTRRQKGGGFGLGGSEALDDEGAGFRIVQPPGQDLLVLRRVVPALHRGGVGEFKDDDALRFRAALDEPDGAAARQKPAAILRNRRGHGGTVIRHRLHVGDIEIDNEIGRHVPLPELICSEGQLRAG